MTSIIDAAKQAFAQGFAPIRINRQTKLPLERGWQTNAFVRDESICFSDDDNIGLACGYGGLTVADCDLGGTAARQRVIDKFGMPFASVIRPDAPDRFKFFYRQALPDIPAELIKAATEHQQHARTYDGKRWLKDRLTTYKPFAELRRAFIRDHGLIATQTFSDPVGLEKYEIKSFGAQIVIPPSQHPAGARFVWEVL